jgi:hypothetical protein
VLPFTREQFLQVFAAYNERLWPLVVLLWIVTAYQFVDVVRGRKLRPGVLLILLGAHWAWAAIAYHAWFFAEINPAAWLFSAVFLVEAFLLLWCARGRFELQSARSSVVRQRLSTPLIAYGLLYPAIARAEGHLYPEIPTFGVPCPTTILTIGFLLMMDGSLPILVSIVPIAWALIGGSASFLLQIRTDLGLALAGLVLAADLVIRRFPRRIPRLMMRVH